MGVLIAHGLDWRSVFWIAASVLFMLLVLNLWLLKESPTQIGRPEPVASPLSLFGSRNTGSVPSSLRELLSPLFGSAAFWLVCVLSLGCTLVRETFNTWTPTYFTEVVGLSSGRAAKTSALFPLFGGASVLLAGYLSDRLGQQGRASLIFYGLLFAAFALLALGYVEPGGKALWPISLVTLIAFLMIGPYSYLAGAIALDFGGKQGSATFSGIIDGIGYLGGVLAGDSIARISVAYGWKGAFLVLSGVTLISCVAAAGFWFQQSRSAVIRPFHLSRAEE
jgi:OPA family glycerol-3-phosphate transporter-like MFS transporter